MNTDRLKVLFEKSEDKYGDAQRIGTTYQTIYNIIYKGSICKVDLLQKIASFYKVPVGYFFEEEEGSINQTNNGNSNVLVGHDNNGHIAIDECKGKLENAQREIEHLKERLKDKEEMIEILKSQLNK